MSDHDRTLDDAGARERALDPTRSFIVQAPAGSGKTELLTQRYLRLLATVEEPEQILAITFTRKAAAEMRARILRALDGAARTSEPEQAHARTTWRLARAVREIDQQRGWKLAEYPARLRIQTIDALTGTLARRLPLLSGTGAMLEPMDDARPLYVEASERLLEHLGESSEAARALEALIAHLGNQVERLSTLLQDLLARRDQWLPALMQARASTDFRAVIERALRGIVRSHLEQLCRTLSDAQRREMWELTCHAAENLLASPSLNGARRKLLEGYARMTQVPGPDVDSYEAWQIVADIFLKRDGELYRSVTKTQGFPSTSPLKPRMQALLRELAEDAGFCEQLKAVRTLPAITYNDEQWEIMEALFNVLPLAVAELHIVFQQQKRADYVENSLRALRALGTVEEATDLALALDARIRHILIDEFQDTSFTQLDLLERLTAGWTPGDGRTLFCVGDPMQSIYRFRQAEVGLFLELQRRGLKHLPLEPLTLTANFRSTQPVVRWVNDVFRTVFPPHDDIEQGAVRYSASVAARAEESGGVHIHPSINGSAAETAQKVVQIVQSVLARDEEGTIAILVAGRNHLGSIAAELQAAGIEHQAVEIEMLSERPVVQDLMALTRALVHLADRTAWLAVLRAPWCGLTLADLHAIAAGAPQATVRELLEHALATNALSADGRERAARAYRVLEQALEQRGRQSLRDWVERTWISLGGPATLREPQDLQDARAYFNRLDEIDEVGDLDDVARLDERLEGLCARPRAGTSARVEVMTIHKAKGLEFDTVIVPSLERFVRSDEPPLLYWTRVAGLEEGLIFAPLTAAGADADPIYRWAASLERERTDHERARLLYVAATRAKRELHLLGNVQTKENGAGLELRSPRKGSMLALLWPHLEPLYQSALQSYAPTGEREARRSGSVPLRRLPLEWCPPAPDPEVQLPEGTRLEIVDATRPEFDWVTETSRRIGTLVHRELERIVANGNIAFDAEAHPGVRARMRAELIELGVPEDRCEAALARVFAAIQATLEDPKGRWLLGLEGSIRDAYSELALSGIVNGQVIQSIIDRTFVDASGTRWVVDFKTSTHEGAGLEAFLAQEAERYRPQLERYATLMRALYPAEPVKAALYFPLLQRWVEVTV
ncbi:MAG: UvrD-helicase domain-containing protein [Gammaproteobacteria bacterium]